MKHLFPARWNRIVPVGAAMAAAIALLAPGAAQATPYVVKLTQQGNNVLATGSGEFDLTGLTLWGVGTASQAYIDPLIAEVNIGPTGAALDGYTGFNGPTAFGMGTGAMATSAGGDFVFIAGSVAGYGFPVLAVPQGYISGTALASDAFWDNANFASLGVTPGVYTWTWGPAADQSFTLDAVTTVPEPAALGMLGLGLLLVGGFLTLRPRHGGGA